MMPGLPVARLGGGRHRHLPPGADPLSLHLPLHLPRPLQEEQAPDQPGGQTHRHDLQSTFKGFLF